MRLYTKTTRNLAVGVLAFALASCIQDQSFYSENDPATKPGHGDGRIEFGILSDVETRAETAPETDTEEAAQTEESAPQYAGDFVLTTITSPARPAYAAAQTRATVTDPGSIRKIGVFGYSHAAATGWSTAARPDYFLNKAVVLNGSGDWIYDGVLKYWPEDARSLSFYAYAPHSDIQDPNYVITPAAATTAGSPKITYTVPPFIGDQKDLIWSAKPNMTYATSTAGQVPLTFNHAMTMVGFEVRLASAERGAGYTVDLDEITLSGILGKGTFDLATGAWSGVTGATSYSLHNVTNFPRGGLTLPTLNTNAAAGAADFTYRSATSTGDWLMLLPQTLGSSARLKVTYTITDTATKVSTQKSAEFTLTGTTAWSRGGYVKYQLTLSTTGAFPTRTLNIEGEVAYEYNGGSDQGVRITSSAQGTMPDGTVYNTARAMGWTAQFSEDNGKTWNPAPPAWLTFPASDNGSTTPEAFIVTAAARPGVSNSPECNLLKATAPVPNAKASPYNLAHASGTAQTTSGNYNVQNTANCYVVKAPGWYSIPLVYGNAIKNSTANTAAYANTGGTLDDFVRHDGNAISNPWLVGNGTACTPASATLVWMDEPSLVTQIEMVNTRMMRFYVDPVTIMQGNAVLAVKNSSGQVLWSWHIWITPLDTVSTDETRNWHVHNTANVTHATYQFMKYNIGWRTPKIVTSATQVENVLVKITQTLPGAPVLEKTFSVTRNYKIVDTKGECPFFQWGRKDPILAFDGFSTNERTFFWGDGFSYKKEHHSNGTLAKGILNPTMFYTDATELTNWFAGANIYNLWDAPTNYRSDAAVLADVTVVKTVYDPSPVGFKLPPANAWQGFNRTGSFISSADVHEYNIYTPDTPWYFSSIRGWRFHLTAWQSGPDAFYPIAGYRSCEGGIQLNNVGYNWSASMTEGSSYVFNLTYSNSSVSPTHGFGGVLGFPVRPIKE